MGPALTGSRSGYTWTPAFITYGDNNRTQMLRIPEGGHIEDRSISSAFNPYLGIAAYLAAGLDGIDRGLEPGEPNLGNLYSADLETMARRGVRTLPQSLADALGHFERDQVVRESLGPIADEFLRTQARRMARVSRPGRVMGNQALSHGTLRPRMEILNAKNVIVGAGAMGSAAAYHLREARRAGHSDRAIRTRPRPGKLTRGRADHAAFVCRPGLRAAHAGGVPSLERARSRRRRDSLFPHRRCVVLAPRRRLCRAR